MQIEHLEARKTLRRKPTGMAAILLPYDADGRIATDAFERCVRATCRAGLTPAVNMDTGYVNYLSEQEADRVMDWTRRALGEGTPFVAGAYIEGQSGDVVDLYHRRMDAIVARGGTPIIFQTARLHDLSSAEKVKTYQRICHGYDRVIGFELGRVFAPNGEIWDGATFEGMLQIPELIGAKHSSLDRLTELKRLEMRDRLRPEFHVFTGNDWGIDMIEYGSDYLLGVAAFCPEQFALRDRLWAEGDPAYYALADALQYLGNVAFRAPVPAYKHSAAHFLHLLGRIPTSRAHPSCPTRPAWEGEMMKDCLQRIQQAAKEA